MDTGSGELAEYNPGVLVIKAFSPFRSIDGASLPKSAYDRLSLPEVDKEENELDSLSPKMDNLNILEDYTTGKSRFSSPRGFVQQEIREEPALITLTQEVKTNRQAYIKTALGLGQIGTLEESYIKREQDTPAKIPNAGTTAFGKKLKIEK